MSLIKDIVGIGTQFFIIMISMLFIFQFTNIIITRELGAEYVTIYNVTYKIFSIMIVAVTILLNPVWSAFTDAYTKNDYEWVRKCLKRIEKMGIMTVPVIILLLLLSEFIFDIWLGGKVETNIHLTICMAVYAICQIMSQVYMYPLNGMGKVRLQLFVYLFFAVVAIPGIIYFTRKWGIVGTMIVPTLTYFVQAIVNKVQIMKIINKKATGIWNK
jgi:O-antigen/teichoic acid export membrane protein